MKNYIFFQTQNYTIKSIVIDMINESIFTFLSKDEIFIDVYEKALEAEKNIFNEKFDTAFNNMRNIIKK